MDESILVLNSLKLTAELCVGYSIDAPDDVARIFRAAQAYLMATESSDDPERTNLYDTLGLDDA